jgi:hypothetical protein
MIKRYLYAGIILLVIGGLVLYAVSSYITTGTPANVVNVTVLHGRIGEVPVRVNGTAISIIFVFASNSTDTYFLNQSTFGGLSNYLNGSPSRSASSYIKRLNLSSDNVFLNNTSAVKEEYQNTQNVILGSYYVYAVIDSTPGSPSYNSIVNASIVFKSYSFSSWESNSGESLVGIAAVILGIALLIYGAVKKPRVVVEAQEAQAEIQKPQARKKRS